VSNNEINSDDELDFCLTQVKKHRVASAVGFGRLLRRSNFNLQWPNCYTRECSGSLFLIFSLPKRVGGVLCFVQAFCFCSEAQKVYNNTLHDSNKQRQLSNFKCPCFGRRLNSARLLVSEECGQE
jgi:hypothetical protein